MHEIAERNAFKLLNFGADAARAQALDLRVRLSLAESLREIADAIGCDIGFSKSDAEFLTSILETSSVAPRAFSYYADLVEAALRDDSAAAVRHVRSLVEACIIGDPGFSIVTLSDDDLGAGQAEQYRWLISDEPGMAPVLEPVAENEHVRATALIAEALALFDTGAPQIGAEFRALIRQIILVKSTALQGDVDALVLDGASSFYLWGALFLNSERQSDRLSMALALLHEASHGLLFGMALGAPLVDNPDTERFASPLRHDLRPMDGLVHATYVLARMIDCLQCLLRSSILQPSEVLAAQSTLIRHRADYEAALSVALKSGIFTSIGAEAFGQMRRAMEISPQRN